MGDAPGPAERLMKILNSQTAEGIIFPVDARLRPEGQSGPLVHSVAAYRRYFETRAQPWEGQALTKARPLFGPQGEAFLDLAKEAWALVGQRDDLLPQVRAMHERVVKARSAEDKLDYKTGRGGLMEAEFLAQGLQMKHGVWENHTLNGLRALGASGILPEDEVARVTGSYRFLRRAEAVLRRAENTGVSSLPADPEAQRKLAHRLGYPDAEAFFADYNGCRAAIHAVFDRHIR